MWRPWKQVCTPVAWNCESTCCAFIRKPPRDALRYSPWERPGGSCLLRLLQAVDQLVELVVAHEAAHRVVVHKQHGRIGAGAQALALLQCEQAVARRLAHPDAQPMLEVAQRPRAVAQLARQVGADVELV